MTLLRPALLLAFCFLSTPVLAHVDPSEHGSFAAGLTHPAFGLDHVLAMIAVGLWAALIGERAIWLLPTGFVSAMVMGYALSLFGVHLPFVEPMILGSVIVLGLMVAAALPLPLGFGVALCAAFGLFHGHAHGGEIGDADWLSFAAGFVLATIVLHACGVLFGFGAKLGLGTDTRRGELATRFLGVVTALSGLYLVTAA